MASEIQYPDDFVQRLELIWGEGFLSPGGPEEVREIVRGLDMSGLRLLDIGCGIGGPALVLAGELGAAQVVGVDLEPQLLARARQLAESAGVADRVIFQQVEPGALPFAEASFDLVFSKDALIHVEDKAGLYREVLRVLKPGGRFAASDWLVSAEAAETPAFLRFRDLAHLSFALATADETEAVMREAGFEEVSTRDRNAWFAERSAFEAEQVAGPLYQRLVEAVGAEVADHWIAVRRALAEATAVGALRPTHLFGARIEP